MIAIGGVTQAVLHGQDEASATALMDMKLHMDSSMGSSMLQSRLRKFVLKVLCLIDREDVRS